MKNKKILRLASFLVVFSIMVSSVLIPGFVLAVSPSYEVWDGTTKAPSNGKGTVADPYLITNGAELAWAVTNVGQKYFKLTEDIYLNNVSKSNWYSQSGVKAWNSGEMIGYLNGNGHVIYGLYINTQVYGNYGLVKKFNLDSSIKNLGIESAYIKVSGSAGAFFGERSWIMDGEATISNCYVGKDVIVRATEAAGGIFGYNTAGKMSIENCYSLADVKGNTRSGGIYGDLYGTQRPITVNCCYTSSKVLGSNGAATITNSYCTDDISADKMQGKDVFTNSSKMPLLNQKSAYVALSSYPTLRMFADIELTEYKVKDLSGKYKTHGRTALVDGALMLDHSASGIEFNVDAIGNVEITVTADVKNTSANGGIYFTVVVDDKVMYQDLRIPSDNNASVWKSNNTGYPFHITKSGEATFVIAEDLDAGEHNIKVYTQTEPNDGVFGVKSIALEGSILEASEDSELYIEVVGDSIAAGLGNISVGGQGAPLYQDATRAWPFLVAKTLSADLSVIAQSGITATNGIGWQGEDSVSMQTVYPLQRYFSDKNLKYNFKRNPDAIVVSLGTNDIWTYGDVTGATLDTVKDGIKDMLTLLREKNPDSKIIWLYGMMTASADDVIVSAISEMGGESKGFYTLAMPQNTEGGQGHPDLEAQTAYSYKVVDCLRKVLELSYNENVWDGRVVAPTQGNGTASNPYLITNGGELAWAVNNYGATFGQHYFKLTDDIYLNDVSKSNWYTKKKLNVWNGGEMYGHLDGDGHVIYGLYINNEVSGDHGLITKLNLDSTIKNLGIENSYISTKGYAGALVGGRSWKISKEAVISNCYVGADVIIRGGAVGGLVGVNTCGGLVISDSYSLADVSGVDYSGGIIGDMYGKSITLKYCYANTNLAGKDTNVLVRTACYEPTKFFTKQYMQGKDVFINYSKMYLLNSNKQYASTEGYPILKIFSDNPDSDEGGADVPTFTGGYESGKGTKKDPYIIKTVDQLRYLISDSSTLGKYYKLANDIHINDTSDPEWIKNNPKPWYIYVDGDARFAGTFDGDGHYIYGIYVNQSSANAENFSDDGAGLFPYIDRTATIKNVHIRNSFISGHTYAGAIAGFCYNIGGVSDYAEIIGCSADESVTVDSYAAGGLLGGGVKGIGIYYSYFTGKVVAIGEGRGNALVGDVWNTDQKVAQCYTVGYENYRSGFIPSDYADVYSSVKQKKAIHIEANRMIGAAAQQNMSKLDWNYWSVVEGDTPHPKIISEDSIEYFIDEGVKGRVWSGKIATKFAGGSGKENDPYLIETPEQMAYLINLTKEYAQDQKYIGAYYKLTADLKFNDTSKKNWEQSARQWYNGPYYFDGYFDGDGHVVSGLYYSNSGVNDDMVGLFPYVQTASVIKNIGITESTLISKWENSQSSYTSALIGGVTRSKRDSGAEITKTLIQQCFADDTVYLEGSSTGGFVAFGPFPVKVDNCFFTGKMKYKNWGGGLIGDSWVEGNEISNCFVASADREPAMSNSAVHTVKLVENIYVDGPKYYLNAVNTLNLMAMKGEYARKFMPALDYENVWKIVEDGTPVLRVFGSDKYTCTRDARKVTIKFNTGGGSQCEPITGYPRFTEITKLPTPTRYGYKFDGWYHYAELDVPFELKVFPEYDIYLFPKWVQVGFSRDFEKNDINTRYDINGSVRHYRAGVRGYNIDYVHGGMKSLQCRGDTKFNPAFLLSYKNKLNVGEVYELTFWMTTETENASGKIELIHTKYPDVHDEIYAVETCLEFKNLKVGVWKQYKIKFTAGTPYLILRTPSDTCLYFDDIQIYETGKKGKFSAELVSGKLENTEHDDEKVEETPVVNKKPVKVEKENKDNEAVNVSVWPWAIGAAGAVVVAAAVVIFVVLLRKKKKEL